jgi:hypothetical protein
MEDRLNDTEMEQPNYSQNTLSQQRFAQHKSKEDWSEIELRSLQV